MAIWNWTVTDSSLSLTRLDVAVYEALHRNEGEWTSPTQEFLPSRSNVKKLIRSGLVRRNSQECKPSEALEVGDAIQLETPTIEEVAPQTISPAIDVPILFEDEDIVVVNKPQGMPVHPASSNQTLTLVEYLLGKGISLHQGSDDQRPGVVHRIDKNTTGALVLAKSSLAYLKLCEAFSNHNIDRCYWAITYQAINLQGQMPSSWVKVENLIGRNPKDRKKMSIVTKNGKPAITWLRPIEAYRELGSTQLFASLIEAKLETGRTHQVRVHLASLGSSIVGDDRYGIPSRSQDKWRSLPPDIQSLVANQKGQALHARQLAFYHPRTQKPLSFKAEPFEAFSLLLSAFRRYEIDVNAQTE